MKKYRLVPIVLLFSHLLVAAENFEFSQAEKIRVLKMMASNPALFVPKVKPPALAAEPEVIATGERIWNLFGEEKPKGKSAYYILRSLLVTKTTVAHFRDRVLTAIPDSGISAAQEKDLRALANAVREEDANDAPGRDTGTPAQIFTYLGGFLASLPDFFPDKHKLQDAVAYTRGMVISPLAPETSESPSQVWAGSKGLIYHESYELAHDADFLIDSVRFYVRLAAFDAAHPHPGNFDVYDSTKENLWKLAKHATGGNGPRALRVLSAFGHDQCCNGLYLDKAWKLRPYLELLNYLSPTPYNSDNPNSLLQAPGSLNGVTISSTMRSRFRKIEQRYVKLGLKVPKFRMGYYHVLGGVLSATELIRNGYAYADGVNLASFVSEGLGYYYKKFTMTLWLSADAGKLWQAMGQEETSSPVKPADWTEERYERAILNLDENILFVDFTREQHRKGADFAYEVFLGLH